MKVYSPRAGVPVLLKLEGDVGPSEVSTNTTVANAWETLTWNFAGKPSNVYNKLVFMFDFGTVGNGTANSTFLFDDIYQISSASNTLSLSANALTIAAAANSTSTFTISSNVSWSIASDQNWLTANTVNGTGNATITLTAEMNPANSIRIANVTISAAGVVPQTLIVTQELGTTGVSYLQNPSIKIYPNPTNNVLMIEGFAGNATVMIFDVSGKMLLTEKVISKQVDISSLVNGIYLIKITDKKGVTVTQFVKL
jgi:hypothetical protein